MEIKNFRISPLLICTAFQTERDVIARMSRVGYSPRYLAPFFRTSGDVLICRLDDQPVLANNISDLNELLFKQEESRFKVEALFPLWNLPDQIESLVIVD